MNLLLLPRRSPKHAAPMEIIGTARPVFLSPRLPRQRNLPLLRLLESVSLTMTTGIVPPAYLNPLPRLQLSHRLRLGMESASPTATTGIVLLVSQNRLLLLPASRSPLVAANASLMATTGTALLAFRSQPLPPPENLPCQPVRRKNASPTAITGTALPVSLSRPHPQALPLPALLSLRLPIVSEEVAVRLP